MKLDFRLLLISVVLFAACQSANAPKSGNSNAQEQAVVKDGLKMHPDHPNIPMADKGITVVNPQGWTTDQMTFHINYCMQMMGSVDEIDPLKFCECFLTKIEYYYEPKFFKEAYEDQQTWNARCFEEAQL